MFRKTVFAIDNLNCPAVGYTEGKLWNGWATPYFPLEEAIRVMEDFNKASDIPMHFSEELDAFILYDDSWNHYEIWKGANYTTDEGIKHLYSIGAFSWVWDEWSAKEIAKLIRFMLEDYEIEMSSEAIRQSLENAHIRRMAMDLLESDETEEFKIAKIGVLLRICKEAN